MFLGHGRMYYDARAWLETSKVVHSAKSEENLEDLTGMLHLYPETHKTPHVISYRGSIVKYCYALSIEIYFKWILVNLQIDFKEDHRIANKLRLVPSPHIDNIRKIYRDYWAAHSDGFKFFEVDTSGRRETGDDWSTLHSFVKNLDHHKFVMGRYATPEKYSVVRSISTQLSREMNRYMDSSDFFEVAEQLLTYAPFKYGIRISTSP